LLIQKGMKLDVSMKDKDHLEVCSQQAYEE
jgi:hypothetical protein